MQNPGPRCYFRERLSRLLPSLFPACFFRNSLKDTFFIRTLFSRAFEEKGTQTRRKCFLTKMEKVAPWASRLALIEPHYPTTGRCDHPQKSLTTMQRIYSLLQRYTLSGPAMKDALYEIESMRRFRVIKHQAVTRRCVTTESRRTRHGCSR